MCMLTPLRAEERGSVFAVARAHVNGPDQPATILSRLFDWRPGDSRLGRESGWERVACLEIGRTAGNQLRFNPNGSYRVVKLRAPSMDVEIRRLTPEFIEGSLQDLSIGSLLCGCESRPMNVVGRDLKGIALEYDARARARGKVEVWACP